MKPWYPRRFYLVFWGLERVLWSNWAGTAFKWHRYRNGLLRLFWTRAQAQQRTNELNQQEEHDEQSVR